MGKGKKLKYYNNKQIPKRRKPSSDQEKMTEELEKLPVIVQVQSIQKFVDALTKKGKAIRDWDHKERIVNCIKIIGGELYILSEAEVEDASEYEDALRAARKDNAFLAKECRALRTENERLRKRGAKDDGIGDTKNGNGKRKA